MVMTALRTAMVAGDGHLHATAEWQDGGLTLCRQVAASTAHRAVAPGRFQPFVTCQDCREALNRTVSRRRVRAA